MIKRTIGKIVEKEITFSHESFLKILDQRCNKINAKYYQTLSTPFEIGELYEFWFDFDEIENFIMLHAIKLSNDECNILASTLRHLDEKFLKN